MIRSTDRILTTHVGSIIRPPELRKYLGFQRDRVPYDETAYEACLRTSVADVVQAQFDAGLDVIDDGEMSKMSWTTYLYERLGGLEHRKVTGAWAIDSDTSNDRRMFAEYWADYEKSQVSTAVDRRGFVCTGPVSYIGQDKMRRDIENLKAALTGVEVAGAFLPVVAPASVANVHLEESPYKTDEEWVYAIAEVLREEYMMILDAGLILQVDDAYIPWMYDLTVPPGTLEDYRAWASLRIEALNHALRGLPQDRIRYHICWGSFNGPHVGDVPAKDIIDLVLRVNAGTYLIEMGNARHAHEWKIWRDVALPEGKVLAPGVISHTTNVVEHPELVAERLIRLGQLVGRENVIGSGDCGFAGGAFTARVHPTIMWAKFHSLVEGAKLATQELWNSPVTIA